MAATSNLTAGGSMFVPRVTVSTYQPSQPPSLDNLQGWPARRRARCISCSDNSFEESSSFLLEQTLLPRRVRTASVCERIKSDTQSGTVSYFCKSRGHGFLQSDGGRGEHFVHVSDVESEFVPMKGDQVSFRLCPIPPKFEKCQAVNVQITKMSPQNHNRWDAPQSPEDQEDPSPHPPPADV